LQEGGGGSGEQPVGKLGRQQPTGLRALKCTEAQGKAFHSTCVRNPARKGTDLEVGPGTRFHRVPHKN